MSPEGPFIGGAAERSPWIVRVLTLFPDMFPGPLGLSLAGKALRSGLWRLEATDLRGFAHDRHRSVDDTPFGGGAGMVMRPDVLDEALTAVAGAPDTAERGRLLYLTPRGRRLDQGLVAELAGDAPLTLLCGRYEGIDERVIEAHALEEVSLGDFVLSGGELAAMVLIDACVRLLPGVVGNEAGVGRESFDRDLLEYPHYTRPAAWTDRRGIVRPVPEVLLSGHHAQVEAWREAQAESLTRSRRPDLWARHQSTQTATADPAPGKTRSWAAPSQDRKREQSHAETDR